MWNSMFGMELSILEKIIRPIIVYLFLVIFLRVFGKRELAQLNPFDLVVLLSLSNTVQNAIIGNDNSVSGGLIGAFALLTMNYLVVRFLFRHRRLDQIFEGSPTTLIENGKVRAKALADELLTHSELITILHRQGIGNVNEVEKCVLEPGGTVFVQRKEPTPEETYRDQVLDRLKSLESKIELLAQRG